MSDNIYRTIRDGIAGLDGSAVRDGDFHASYGLLFRDVDALADDLEGIGVLPGARVALLGRDSYEYIVISLAVMSLDAALVPISSNSAETEIADLLDRIAVNWVIRDSRCRGGPPGDPLAVGGAGLRRFAISALRREISPPLLPSPDTPAFIRFSSGTTGTSKGVVLSHRAVIERTLAADQALNMSADDSVLWVLDMAYHFVVTILLFLRKGSCIVICDDAVQNGMAGWLARSKITVLYATPFHYQLLSSSKEIPAGAFASLRLAVSTATGLDPAVAQSFRERTGLGLSQAYGIIEVGLPFFNASGLPEKAASVGRVLPAYEVDLRGLDESGRGAIWLRGKGMFDAYFSPFRLHTDLSPDDWFDTGDIGYLDPDGFLYIVGRSRHVLNFLGMKVFPYEVETVLREHPCVAEAMVRGKPVRGFGEVPVAEVVPRASPDVPADFVRELRRFCFERLAAFKVPKEITLVRELERTASGKVIH
jgi:long-chain acyl-CoA synthetase